jgi:sugar O-acyltransferase (sialic acid O-acetyltransferase NeuD family)
VKKSATVQVAVFGAGGFAREVAWLVQECSSKANYVVVCFVDQGENTPQTSLNGIPVLQVAAARQRFPNAIAAIGVGQPATRERVVAEAATAGFKLGTFIHPRTEKSEWVEIGEGTLICAGCILTTNIRIGRHVQINLDCTVGHDVVVEDYATIAPGVHVSGNVRVGRGAYLGTGATVVNGKAGEPIVIGEGSIVGAGACVTRSVPAAVTVVGVPARILTR